MRCLENRSSLVRRELDSRDAKLVAEPIEVKLWVGLEIVVQEHDELLSRYVTQHRVEMCPVTTVIDELGDTHEGLVEADTSADPPLKPKVVIRGYRSVDRLPQAHDQSGTRSLGRDARDRGLGEEVVMR
jgi:hypothetical protein